jgi:predicted transcriptional regulator
VCYAVTHGRDLTIRLDEDLQKLLDDLCQRTGRSRSEIVRDALRRQIALLRFEDLRRRTLPFAEARGYLTDEDVFRSIS